MDFVKTDSKANFMYHEVIITEDGVKELSAAMQEHIHNGGKVYMISMADGLAAISTSNDQKLSECINMCYVAQEIVILKEAERLLPSILYEDYKKHKKLYMVGLPKDEMAVITSVPGRSGSFQWLMPENSFVVAGGMNNKPV